MNQLNPRKTGVAVGTFLGGLHFLWSLLIALGWAQALVNFILWAHMVTASSTVGPFNLTAAVTLVIVTSILGYIGGYMFSLIWNHAHRA